MTKRWLRRSVGAVLLAVTLVACGDGDGDGERAGGGPERTEPPGFLTSVNPYIGAVGAAYTVTPLLSVGDRVPEPDGEAEYQMIGVPDGLAALRAADGTMTVFMNHELDMTDQSEARVGGPMNRGAFVSQLVVTEDGRVRSGVRAYDTVFAENRRVGVAAEATNTTPAFGRFCSASLAGREVGFDRPILLTNEEARENAAFDPKGGQTVAVFDREAHTLPRLGFFPKENSLVARSTGQDTVIFSLEDGPTTPDSQLYMYVGRKNPRARSVLRRNGLDNGRLYVFTSATPGKAAEADFQDGTIEGKWSEVVDAASLDAPRLEAAADALGAFGFVRIEDGAFSRTSNEELFFVSTGGGPGNRLGRAYRLRFDPRNATRSPQLSVIYNADQVVASGGDGPLSPDNVDTNERYLMIQEDPTPTTRPALEAKGRVGSVWRLDLSDDFAPERIAELKPPGRDGVPVAADVWESSGIVDASETFGPDSWLLDVQAHPPTAAPAPGTLEDGQLVLLRPARPPGR